MNFKRYNESDNSWTDSHYIMGTDTDTLTALPAVIYPNDTSITVGIKGQSSQSGTPSPSNPVPVNGTGERTGNLFNKDKQAGNIYVTETITRYGVEIPVSAGTYSIVGGTNRLFVKEKYGTTYGTPIDTSAQRIITLPQNGYIIVYAGAEKDYTVSSIMLNAGSTPLPYEPYGIKIPILPNSITTPVYLGEVETTRKICKLVLTGQESWNNVSTGDTQFFYITVSNETISNSEVICTHFENGDIGQRTTDVGIGFAGTMQLRVRPENTSAETLATFKQWLADQYSAGTPVTVWYVLATPETAIVNEPLRKVGDYADEVSGITIPTIAGANTLSIGTTLQPSEVSVNYHGWHPVLAVHERENAAWT